MTELHVSIAQYRFSITELYVLIAQYQFLILAVITLHISIQIIIEIYQTAVLCPLFFYFVGVVKIFPIKVVFFRDLIFVLSLLFWPCCLSGFTLTEPLSNSLSFLQENKCWTNWINNDLPSTGNGDTETNSGACAAATHFDCQTVEGLNLEDIELNKTTCSSSGITCLNSDQRADRSCPDFKVRYVCSCPSKSLNHLFF